MKAYLFDLDGTLTDSRPGLILSFRAGLHALGVELPEPVLAGFLGTPLPELFRTCIPAIDEAGIERGIDAFRRAYEAEGIGADTLYPGVQTLLAGLRAAGHPALVVTSKPEHYARQVVQRLGIDHALAAVIGAGLAETDTKTDLVARALQHSGVPAERCTMLGDRHYDVIGARANSVRPVGALWGYGTQAELAAAGCTLFASSPTGFLEDYV